VAGNWLPDDYVNNNPAILARIEADLAARIPMH
jgi:hypothetical protein